MGQEELLAQKISLQLARKTQIVARLMVEELAFQGMRDADEVATCLQGYDRTAYPEGSQWTFSRFYLPASFDTGYRLVDDAHRLWDAFAAAHHKANLPGKLEIPMESFVRAVEIVLKDSTLQDQEHYRPAAELWTYAVHHCGYVQSRLATSHVLAA